MSSPHSLDLPKRGDISLRDGVLYLTKDGQDLGRIIVGPDGLTIDGCELSIGQDGDPAAFNLLTKDNRGAGKLSWKIVRDDGRGEEVAYFNGGLAEDSSGPPDYRGQLTLSIRRAAEQDTTETVFVATAAYGRVWTGLRNFAGWLWKWAYPGDDGPYGLSGGGAAPSMLRSPNGRYDMEMQDDGVVVVYDEVGDPDADPPVAPHTAIAAFRPGFGL